MREINFEYITTQSGFDEMRLGGLNFDGPIGVDIETTDLEPWHGKISTVQLSDGERTFVLDWFVFGGIQFIADGLRYILEDPKILKVAHNAKFEIKWFMYHLGAEPESFFDTMLGSQLIAAGDVSASHHLKDVAETFLGVPMDKTEQLSDWSVRPLTQSQLKYAAFDAEVVIPIYHEQVARLKADDLTRVAVVEFESIKPIARCEINGLHLDRERWGELLTEKVKLVDRLHGEMLEIFQAGVDWSSPNPAKRGKRPVMPKKPVNPLRSKDGRAKVYSPEEREAIELEHADRMGQYNFELNRWQHEFDYWERLPATIPATLNPSSVPQMKKVIRKITGLNLESTNTDKVLVNYVDRYPAIAKLVEYREADKALSAYGQNFLDKSARDGRVHTSFKQILDTGRMSSREPNIQQIPSDAGHRRCFTAPPGRKLVIADYSQIELRMLAELARDAAFVGDFNSGEDMHVKGARRFFRIPDDVEVAKEKRQEAKAVNFGTIFGIMGMALARRINSTDWEAERLIEAYFKAYPGNKLWLDKANRQARQSLFARTRTGRIQRMSHDGSRGQVNAIGRNGMNMPIQGSAADMLKRALYFLDRELRGTTAWLVNIVHDELVIECDEADAEWAGSVLKESMERAGREYITAVPVDVEAHVAEEWTK
jgi:DNA polymerase I-like protein with 3'-5' exonuclease and polymerase domains